MYRANLSNDYFEKRQDRYIWIQNCESLCDFFASLIGLVSSFSFQVDKSGSLTYPHDKNHPVFSSKDNFGQELSTKINNLLNDFKQRENLTDAGDTLMYPLIQMSDAFTKIDEKVTINIFEKADQNTKIYLAVGYFNLTDEYMNAIVKQSTADYDLLLASPEANGFFGAKGLSGYIPSIYSCLEEEFFKFCSLNNQLDRINLFEYKKNDWSKFIK